MARIIQYNGKFYDTKSPNGSFSKVALDLKRAGVENWYFLLEIKDVNLININPYQVDNKTGKTTLSKNQIEHIMLECKQNPWYYLREISRIPEPGLDGGVMYRANRGNIAQAWCLIHGIDSWLCLTRQQGKTISMLALITWIYSFGTTNSTFIFVNKDQDNAKENLRRVCDQIDLLPEYLRFESVLIEDEEDGKTKIVKARKNATTISHPVTKNKIITKSKATSYSNALSLARGLTSSLIHFD